MVMVYSLSVFSKLSPNKFPVKIEVNEANNNSN